jgi:Immunity protein 35
MRWDKQMTISFDQARVIAEKTVRAIADSVNDEFVIVDNETIDEGWLFVYNTKDFMETGNFRSSLAGNGPIFYLLASRT